MGWRHEHLTGSAAAFHAREVPDPAERAVWSFAVDGTALVLGSTQADAVVDRERAGAAGVAVVRRRSGGGAVLVEPGAVVWVDVVLPRGDPLWDDDVSRSALWVGDAWAAALAGLAGVDGHVHRGPMTANRWSRLVCFAGLAAGEVTVAGRKVVGVSQRRTRAAARFQCALLLRWRPRPLLDLLALAAGERVAAAADLVHVADGVDVPVGRAVDAFVGSLPS